MQTSRLIQFAAVAATTAILSTPFCCTAAVYDPAAQFSTNSNPNGVWRYGYSSTLGGTFLLHTNNGPHPGYTTIDNWHTDLGFGIPVTLYNSKGTTVTNDTGTVVLGPGQLALHPGTSGEFDIVRFTSPVTMTYQVTGSFFGADIHPTTTDVHLLLNGTSILNGFVNGFGAGTGPSFSTNLVLNLGDRLDFAVSWGVNNEFSYDSTGLSVSITEVPEPTSFIFAAAAVCLIAVTRRFPMARSKPGQTSQKV